MGGRGGLEVIEIFMSSIFVLHNLAIGSNSDWSFDLASIMNRPCDNIFGVSGMEVLRAGLYG